MAGLDNIKHFAPGGSTGDASAEDTTDTGALAQAKAPTNMGKGPYLNSLPSAAGASAISPELLQNMQQMIAEREARKNSFMENLKDANAWWSGGIAGPGEALRARAAEREGQDATTFGMKSALAQYKAAQAAAQSRAKSLKDATNPTGASAGTGAPGTGMPPNVTAEINRLLSLDPPDVAAAEALRSKWAGNESKFDAARHTQQKYFISPEIGNMDLDPEQWAYFKQTGILPNGQKVARPQDSKPVTPAATTTPVATTQTAPTNTTTTAAAPTSATQTSNALPHTQPLPKINPISAEPLKGPDMADNFPVKEGEWNQAPSTLGTNTAAAKAAGVPVLSGYRDNTKQAELVSASQQPGYKGPPVAPVGKSLHQTDEAIDVPDVKALKPEQLKWLRDNGYRQTVANDPNHFGKIPGISAAPAEAANLPTQKAALMSASTTSELPFPTPKNKEEVDANNEYRKKRAEKELEITGKGPETASTEAGKRQAQMYKLNEDADKTIEAADQVIAASKSHPESVGIGKGFTGANVLTTVAGALVPKMDKSKAEQQYADLALGKEAIAARDQVITASKQLGISFAADVFKGARMGIGLENMAANAKGVSEHNLAENNLINATLIKEAAIFNKQRAALFDEWKKTHGGKLADFEKFETSPEYNALKEQTQKKIVAQLPQYLKLGNDGLEEKNPSKSTSSENGARAELERRKKAKGNQ